MKFNPRPRPHNEGDEKMTTNVQTKIEIKLVETNFLTRWRWHSLSYFRDCSKVKPRLKCQHMVESMAGEYAD
jgi:hypothetical protein